MSDYAEQLRNIRSKLNAATMCHPNGVQTLLVEALDQLDAFISNSLNCRECDGSGISNVSGIGCTDCNGTGITPQPGAAAMRQACCGFRSSGYWKGYPCGAVAKYQSMDGRWWCKNHLPINAFIQEQQP